MTIKNYVDYYGLLGLQHSATADEIRVAYKSLVRRIFSEIRNGLTVLSRRRYVGILTGTSLRPTKVMLRIFNSYLFRHTEKKDEASMRFVEVSDSNHSKRNICSHLSQLTKVNDAYRFLSNQRRRELEQDGISGTSVQQASPSTPSKSDIDKLKRSNDSSNNGRQTPRMKSAPNFKVFEQKSEEPEKEPRGTPPKPRKPRPKSTPDGRA
jgi:hypothetical protein